jgi:hydrogenase maturation protein HypF
MWHALLQDLRELQNLNKRPPTPQALSAGHIAARFHHGLANAVVRMAAERATEHGVHTVALGVGVFQNRILAEGVCLGLRARGLKVLMPCQVPANDGGLAWGQALVALAQL